MMTIKLLVIGKTDKCELQQLIGSYEKRLAHYIHFELDILPDIRKTKIHNRDQQKQAEGEAILQKINASDRVYLLDERGKPYSSIEFAGFLQKQMNMGIKRLVFIIGGPFGFSGELYDRANGKISLSKMTFSHQMVRLFMVEQLYRAFTILRNEPYHHQ